MAPKIQLIHGDCLEAMQTMPADYVDSVVTDPPYGLSFMGRNWDHGVPGEAFWAEALRISKPGAHLLAFGGDRTHHRLMVAIEDAGWEIRTCIYWVFGSGFPKSLNVSKHLDKMNGETGRMLKFTRWYRDAGVTRKATTEALIEAGHISENGTMAGHYFASTEAGQPAIPTRKIWATLRPLCGNVPPWVDELVDRIEAEREVVGIDTRYNEPSGIVSAGRDERTLIDRKITAPATEAAKKWDGWGTALKPAVEIIVMARKPLEGTVAGNVLKWGTGALNIDGCRVKAVDGAMTARKPALVRDTSAPFGKGAEMGGNGSAIGRYPATLIHDGSPAVMGMFPVTTSGGSNGTRKSGPYSDSRIWNTSKTPGANVQGGLSPDSGSAARFFQSCPFDDSDIEEARLIYQGKATKRDRDQWCDGLEERVAGIGDVDESSGRDSNKPGNQYGEGSRRRVENGLTPTIPRRNHHATVKPTSLMRYLVRLVTPPGGTVLDPFAGSGSTGKAAFLEGFGFIGIEKELEYYEIMKCRVGKGQMKLL